MSYTEVEFHTSQNVTINYEIASVGDRIVASILDWLIKGGYVFAVFFIALKLVSGGLDKALWPVLACLLPVFFYTLLFEVLMQGQTPGKRIMKIKVAMLDGSPATLSAYLIRWLFSFLGGTISIIVITLNNKGQRLGDILAKTTVIKLADRVSLVDTLFARVNSDYIVKYSTARLLNDSDVNLIKTVLNNQQYRDNFELLYSITNKVQAKMNVSREESPEEFLETVVKDYFATADQ